MLSQFVNLKGDWILTRKKLFEMRYLSCYKLELSTLFRITLGWVLLKLCLKIREWPWCKMKRENLFPQDWPWDGRCVLTIDSWMLSQGMIIFHFHSWTKYWRRFQDILIIVFLMATLVIFRLRLPWKIKRRQHLLALLVPMHIRGCLWSMQCSRHFSKMHGKYL